MRSVSSKGAGASGKNAMRLRNRRKSVISTVVASARFKTWYSISFGSVTLSSAAVASGRQNGREADGQEIDKTGNQAFGRGDWRHGRDNGSQHSAPPRPQAAPGEDLKGLARTEVRARGPRRRGPDGRAAPLGGVPRLPRPRRRGDRSRNPGARHPRPRLVAPLGRGSRVVEGPSRLTFHFTPTLASWMNAVEGFFSRPVRQRLKNAVFGSLDACVAGDRGLHRAPQRQGRPPVPLEPRPGGSCGVLEAGAQEAPGNGIK